MLTLSLALILSQLHHTYIGIGEANPIIATIELALITVSSGAILYHITKLIK